MADGPTVSEAFVRRLKAEWGQDMEVRWNAQREHFEIWHLSKRAGPYCAVRVLSTRGKFAPLDNRVFDQMAMSDLGRYRTGSDHLRTLDQKWEEARAADQKRRDDKDEEFGKRMLWALRRDVHGQKKKTNQHIPSLDREF